VSFRSGEGHVCKLLYAFTFTCVCLVCFEDGCVPVHLQVGDKHAAPPAGQVEARDAATSGPRETGRGDNQEQVNPCCLSVCERR